MLTLLSVAATLAAVLVSSTVAALVSWAQAAWGARRRAAARADEVALIAAAAQRWRMTPAEWGGPPADAFAGATFDALGMAPLPLRPDRRRTDHGVYRLVHVPPCPTLDLAAQRTGLETGGDGLLVVGWDPVSGDDTAVVVLGPLVQVPLARVPWAWIAALGGAAEPLAGPAAAGKPAVGAPAPAALRPAAVRRPRVRPVVAGDRPAVPALRLVHWPDRPAHPTIGVGAPDRAPPEPPGWRRAA